MSHLAAPLARLIEQFERLPGIGHKSAQRLAFHILNMSEKGAEEFTAAITEAREKIHECARCCNLTEQELCPVCRADGRDTTTICVVEDARDVLAFNARENTAGHIMYFTAQYRRWTESDPSSFASSSSSTVLRMRISPRLSWQPIPPWRRGHRDVYIQIACAFGVKVTRLAYGIPVGGDLGMPMRLPCAVRSRAKSSVSVFVRELW